MRKKDKCAEKTYDLLKEIEKDIYTEAGLYECCEADQINDAEQGFMYGYISS
ncbi:MAG: hypothetical protein QXK37_02545 [Candidatus Woesearchaeota archaeon]